MEESRGHTINLCLDYIPNIQDYHKCLIKNNLIITSNTYELWQNVCYKKKWYTLTLLLKFHFFFYSIIKIDNYYYFFNSQFLPLKSITLCEIIYCYISLLRTYILLSFHDLIVAIIIHYKFACAIFVHLRCRATGRVQKREKQRWFAFLYIFYNNNSIINKEKN